MSKNKKEISILLYGDKDAGKLNLINNFFDIKSFNDVVDGFDEYRGNIELENGEKISCTLCITSGMKRYKYYYNKYSKDLDGVIFIFSFWDKKTFESMKKMVEYIKNSNSNFGLAIFGNYYRERGIQDVDPNDVKNFAKENNLDYYNFPTVNKYVDTEEKIKEKKEKVKIIKRKIFGKVYNNRINQNNQNEDLDIKMEKIFVALSKKLFSKLSKKIIKKYKLILIK